MLKVVALGIPWSSNGWDSELPMHWAQVRSLVGELDLDFMSHS